MRARRRRARPTDCLWITTGRLGLVCLHRCEQCHLNLGGTLKQHRDTWIWVSVPFRANCNVAHYDWDHNDRKWLQTKGVMGMKRWMFKWLPALLMHMKNIQGQTAFWTAAHIQLFLHVFLTILNTREVTTAKSTDNVYLQLHRLEVDLFLPPKSASNQQEWHLSTLIYSVC